MELCTSGAIPYSNLPQRSCSLLSLHTRLPWKTSLPLKKLSIPRTNPGFLRCSNASLRATSSEEKSSGSSQYVGEEPGTATVEDRPVEKFSYVGIVENEEPKEDSSRDGQVQSFEFLDKLDVKLDSEDALSVLLLGGTLIALWFSTVVVGAIDSIPVFPKLMEAVGLGYTFWFSARYLIFKKNREELVAKIEEIKQQVLGSNDN